MNAWLITPPRPELRAPRRITPRVAGRIRTAFRLPVRFVRVLYVLPELRLARVTDRTGSEYYGRFDCLASTRDRFRSRWLALADITPELASCFGTLAHTPDGLPDSGENRFACDNPGARPVHA